MSKLTLYYSEASLNCHRVRIALKEKGLEYEEICLNLGKLEYLTPSFIRVNPNGQVPTLKHGDKIMTKLEKIMNYLDDAFPDSVRLFPDPSTEEGRRCEYYIRLANKVDLETLSLGVPVHRDFEKCEIKSAYPTSAFRHLIRVFHSNGPERCDKLAAENPDLKDAYLKNKEWASNLKYHVPESVFGVSVPQCNDVMTKLEIELQERKDEFLDKEGHPWLCGENFTAADIYWSTVLSGMYDLGLETRYWEDEKRPLVAAYFERARNRRTFIATAPRLSADNVGMMHRSEKSLDGKGNPCCPFLCTIL